MWFKKRKAKKREELKQELLKAVRMNEFYQLDKVFDNILKSHRL